MNACASYPLRRFASLVIALAGFVAVAATARAHSYYLDGRRTEPGNGSLEAPWRTFADVAPGLLHPGDMLRLACGSRYDGILTLPESGTVAAPITVTDYGEGAPPELAKEEAESLVVVTGSYVVIERLHITAAKGPGFTVKGAHVTIRDCEVSGCGTGVELSGAYGRVLQCRLHDMHMIRNTQGGDDDYGANGIIVTGSHAEIAGNTIRHCIDQSFDYGVDGGAVELYGHIEDIAIHHNRCEDSDGVFELGGGSARHIRITDNTCVHNAQIGGLHLQGTFKSQVADIRFEHNTVVERSEHGRKTLLWFNGTEGEEQFTLADNIIVYEGFERVSDGNTFQHRDNLYWSPDQTPVGYPLGPGERVADPRFVAPERGDYTVKPDSPARRNGKLIAGARP